VGRLWCSETQTKALLRKKEKLGKGGGVLRELLLLGPENPRN